MVITGSSRGFGRRFVEAALSRGDKVATTARNPDSLADLVAAHGDAILPLSLDVTDKAAVIEAVKQAHERFGRLDVVVNNAGFGLFGTVASAGDVVLTERVDKMFRKDDSLILDFRIMGALEIRAGKIARYTDYLGTLATAKALERLAAEMGHHGV